MMFRKLGQWMAVLCVVPLLNWYGASAFGQTDDWISEGPNGGVILDLVARGDRLFAATSGGGVFSLDPETGVWSNVGGKHNGLQDMVPLHLILGDDETVYAGGEQFGVFRYDEASGEWVAMGGTEEGRSVRGLTFANGRLILGDQLGVRYYDESQGQWRPLGTNSPVYLSSLTSDSEGRVYASFTSINSGEQPNVAVLNLGSSQWAIIGNNQPVIVTELTSDSLGRLYGLGGNNVYRYDSAIDQWLPLTPSDPIFFPESILVDTQGRVHVGTNENGVYRWDETSGTWENLGNKAGLFHSGIISLAESPEGTLLAGSGGGGVFGYDEASQVWNNLGDNRGLTNTALSTLAMDPQGRIWTASYLSHFGPDFFNDLYVLPEPGAGLEHRGTGYEFNWVTGIVFPVEGEVLLSTNGGGVFAASGSGEFHNVGAVGNGLEGKATSIQTMMRAVDGSILLATMDGVFRRFPAEEEWLPVGLNDGQGLFGALSLAQDASGALYAGTQEGRVYRWVEDQIGWSPVGIPTSGMENEDVLSLVFGPDGRLYAGAGRRVFAWDSFNARWESIGDEDKGMALFKVYSLAFDSHGTLCAGGYGGVFCRLVGGDRWKDVESSALSNDYVTSILFDREDRLFVATYGNGLFRYGSTLPQATSPDIGTGTDPLMLLNGGACALQGGSGSSTSEVILTLGALLIPAFMVRRHSKKRLILLTLCFFLVASGSGIAQTCDPEDETARPIFSVAEVDSDGDGSPDFSYSTEYGANGEVLRESSDMDGDGLDDEIDVYAYNAQGLLETLSVDDGADGVFDYIYGFEYDATGEQTAEKYDWGADGVFEKVYQITWNQVGNEYHYFYDLDGDPSIPEKIYTILVDDEGWTIEVHFDLDYVGKADGIADQSRYISYSFDPEGSLQTETVSSDWIDASGAYNKPDGVIDEIVLNHFNASGDLLSVDKDLDADGLFEIHEDYSYDIEYQCAVQIPNCQSSPELCEESPPPHPEDGLNAGGCRLNENLQSGPIGVFPLLSLAAVLGNLLLRLK